MFWEHCSDAAASMTAARCVTGWRLPCLHLPRQDWVLISIGVPLCRDGCWSLQAFSSLCGCSLRLIFLCSDFTMQNFQDRCGVASLFKNAAWAIVPFQVCNKWLQGACPFGPKCHFAHGNAELRQRQPLPGGAEPGAPEGSVVFMRCWLSVDAHFVQCKNTNKKTKHDTHISTSHNKRA